MSTYRDFFSGYGKRVFVVCVTYKGGAKEGEEDIKFTEATTITNLTFHFFIAFDTTTSRVRLFIISGTWSLVFFLFYLPLILQYSTPVGLLV